MSVETTYTQARAQLASLMNRVTRDRETVIIRRRNAEPVALIAADELKSLSETAQLLRSPRNAERLLTALAQARRGEGEPSTIEELRRDVGFDSDD